MARPITSPRRRRRAGLRRLELLLDALRDFAELREIRPADFQRGTTPFLHFHFQEDGSIRADVRLSKKRFTEFDVSDEAGQQEVLLAVERHLARTER